MPGMGARLAMVWEALQEMHLSHVLENMDEVVGERFGLDPTRAVHLIIGGGVLESEGGPGVLWYTGTAFADFVLHVDWRLTSIGDNSGIYFRFPPLGWDDPEHNWQLADRQGYEVQIDDRGYNPATQSLNSPLHLTGAIYKLAPALKRASRPVGEWNTFVIEAQCHRLSATLNGELVSSLIADNSRPLRGHIGLQAHHPGSRVQFRNIRIREY